MDTNQRFHLNRATSSLQMKTPIVEFLTPDPKKGEKEITEDEMFDMSLTNVMNNASWGLTDVIFSTPVIMNYILDRKHKHLPFDINPKTIIIDEFDDLMENSNQRP